MQAVGRPLQVLRFLGEFYILVWEMKTKRLIENSRWVDVLNHLWLVEMMALLFADRVSQTDAIEDWAQTFNFYKLQNWEILRIKLISHIRFLPWQRCSDKRYIKIHIICIFLTLNWIVIEKLSPTEILYKTILVYELQQFVYLAFCVLNYSISLIWLKLRYCTFSTDERNTHQ